MLKQLCISSQTTCMMLDVTLPWRRGPTSVPDDRAVAGCTVARRAKCGWFTLSVPRSERTEESNPNKRTLCVELEGRRLIHRFSLCIPEVHGSLVFSHIAFFHTVSYQSSAKHSICTLVALSDSSVLKPKFLEFIITVFVVADDLWLNVSAWSCTFGRFYVLPHYQGRAQPHNQSCLFLNSFIHDRGFFLCSGTVMRHTNTPGACLWVKEEQRWCRRSSAGKTLRGKKGNSSVLSGFRRRCV